MGVLDLNFRAKKNLSTPSIDTSLPNFIPSRRLFLQMSALFLTGGTALYLQVLEIQTRLNVDFDEASWIWFQAYKDQQTIDHPVIDRVAWRELSIKESGPQKYALDCELAGLRILSTLNNKNIGTEDEMINFLRKDIDPSKGIHPDINKVLNAPGNPAWGQIPPYAYGIYAQPIWDQMSSDVPWLSYADSFGFNGDNNRGFGGNKDLYKSTVKGFLRQGMPLLAWTHCASRVGVWENQYVPKEHAIVLCGVGHDEVSFIDPLNARMYRTGLDNLADRANDLGQGAQGLMWVENDY
ncbi:hypothetical protein GW755_03765 [bacterium]|nr:hypothetical protein [bacterium]